MIDGKQLIEWGMAPGKHFSDALAAANAALSSGSDPKAAAMAFEPPPTIPLMGAHEVPHGEFIEPESAAEHENVGNVRETMAELSKTPVITRTAIMPDACPAGPVGIIPVGGIAESTEIHPGMHSSDICCSVAISILGDVDPKHVLDTALKVTHFGGGGRPRGAQIRPPDHILKSFSGNPFLAGLESSAIEQFATQGDGNHFFFVGRLRSTGQVAIVTHHGSRKPGAMLYKRGMNAAEKVRRARSPKTLKGNAWIEADSADGDAYWAALGIIREWTKANHFVIHDMVSGTEPEDRYWNEHNFVFRRGDRFLHGKGATPAWSDYADDANGKVLIPLNMGAPVLIAEGRDRPDALGFCPHGAGRNVSRTAHIRKTNGAHDDLTGIDARWFSGIADPSEMPSAYKSAEAIERQIEKFGLARIVDHIDPYGCIMAGDWQANAPWRKKLAKPKNETPQFKRSNSDENG